MGRMPAYLSACFHLAITDESISHFIHTKKCNVSFHASLLRLLYTFCTQYTPTFYIRILDFISPPEHAMLQQWKVSKLPTKKFACLPLYSTFFQRSHEQQVHINMLHFYVAPKVVFWPKGRSIYCHFMPSFWLSMIKFCWTVVCNTTKSWLSVDTLLLNEEEKNRIWQTIHIFRFSLQLLREAV